MYDIDGVPVFAELKLTGTKLIRPATNTLLIQYAKKLQACVTVSYGSFIITAILVCSVKRETPARP